MNEFIDPGLWAQLDAWRANSRREPRRHARERAYDAMLDAIAVSSRQRVRRSVFAFRPRFAHAGLLAATATVVAAASVAAAGWNAPPGSPLYMVRAARQGVMLKLPGADDAMLHLEFAELSLAEARDGSNLAQSLADARIELAAAVTELPLDHHAALWSRYRLDEATLLSEERGLEPDDPSAPSTAAPRPTDDGTPAGAGSSVGGDDTPSPTFSGSGSPSPSSSWGDDGGHHSPSPSPGGTPRPDE